MVATDVDEGLTAHKGRYGKPAPLFAAWRQLWDENKVSPYRWTDAAF